MNTLLRLSRKVKICRLGYANHKRNMLLDGISFLCEILRTKDYKT